jgi:DNA-directed RNA polymerase specialized sigma24 family protein
MMATKLSVFMASLPMDETSFFEFIKRVRAGDEQAATELVRQYETEIRREVRLRLRDGRLRRDFDSVDICQSVLASFFVRAVLGQYELEQPQQLIKLLVTMTRNKLIGKIRMASLFPSAMAAGASLGTSPPAPRLTSCNYPRPKSATSLLLLMAAISPPAPATEWSRFFESTRDRKSESV